MKKKAFCYLNLIKKYSLAKYIFHKVGRKNCFGKKKSPNNKVHVSNFENIIKVITTCIYIIFVEIIKIKESI